MLLLIMLYYQKCNCQPLIISNWNNGKFSSYLEVENFQACFCLCPPPFLLSPRAKKIFRAREKLFSFPTVLGVQDWRVPSFLPNALQTLEGRFPFPAALFFKFFYPRRPRRTPLQLDTYDLMPVHWYNELVLKIEIVITLKNICKNRSCTHY